MIDIYLDKEDDNITASGTKHPRLCMVIQYNRKTLDLKKFTRFKVKILIGLQIKHIETLNLKYCTPRVKD